MKLCYFNMQTTEYLPDYNYISEQISKSDNYCVHRIIKTECSNPTDVLHHLMYYLNSGKTTPQEISINASTGVVEEISIYVSDVQKNNNLLKDITIVNHYQSIRIYLDECTSNWNGRFLKIQKESELMWCFTEKTICFLFSVPAKYLHSYYISNQCKILLGKDNLIQGFSIEI